MIDAVHRASSSPSDNQRLPKRHLATIIKSPGRLFLILIDAPLSSKLSRYSGPSST